MKRLIYILFFTIFSCTVYAEIVNPVFWDIRVLDKDHVELVAEIDSGWHINVSEINGKPYDNVYYGDTSILMVNKSRPVTRTYNACNDVMCTSPETIELNEMLTKQATKEVSELGFGLKDANDRHLLQDDITSDFGYTLLGKPVYETDNMKDIGAGNTAIFYGDLSGLATKFTEEVEMEVLREKYADQHAIGVVAWMEFDAKVEDAQKISKLVCPGTAE